MRKLEDRNHRLQTAGFSAMGTDISLTVHPATALPDCLTRVLEWFAAVETAASHFNPDSELNQLAWGRRDTASPLLRALRDEAEAIAVMTGGLVTPFERRALELAGYDAPFPDIREGRVGRPSAPFTEWGRLDFGGIGKGWAVDRALEQIAPHCDGALLDAGGDIGVVGASPLGRPWQVTVTAARTPLRVAMRAAASRPRPPNAVPGAARPVPRITSWIRGPAGRPNLA